MNVRGAFLTGPDFGNGNHRIDGCLQSVPFLLTVEAVYLCCMCFTSLLPWPSTLFFSVRSVNFHRVILLWKKRKSIIAHYVWQKHSGFDWWRILDSQKIWRILSSSSNNTKLFIWEGGGWARRPVVLAVTPTSSIYSLIYDVSHPSNRFNFMSD